MWGEIQMAGASSWNNQPPGLVSQLHKHSFQQLLNGPIKNKTHTPPKKKNPRRFSVLRLKPRRKAWRRQSPAKQSSKVQQAKKRRRDSDQVTVLLEWEDPVGDCF